MRIEYLDLREQYSVCGSAQTVLGTLRGIVSRKLVSDLQENLLGFRPEIQTEIVEYLLDYAQLKSMCFTGLLRVDAILKNFYFRIAEELNFFSQIMMAE